MPTSGNACARKGRSETWQFAKNKFWSDFVRKQTFRESRQVLLRKRMSRGFEFVLILQTTRGSNFDLLATEVYLTSFIILVFSTCVRSIRESLGETTPAGFTGLLTKEINSKFFIGVFCRWDNFFSGVFCRWDNFFIGVFCRWDNFIIA
ncbi:hypothetical protein AVEN_275274-1 [Araneus ventricosus]|uniref:Uncharacterized protein n=1 Tax=Araneus ventricosus TaxID=182803 RepID=A0A4Y2I2C8_ARAVE|nr:hypothetical protein AVEN_275274-1 [Araneus ventricosus]